MIQEAGSELLDGIQADQEVIGTCGGHVGTVDSVESGRLRLTGERYLDAALVRSVNDKVHLRTNAEEARAAFSLR